MAKIELTDRRLKALKPKTARFELMDITAGLGVMVHPSGKRTWIFKTRFPGSDNPTRRELGEYPTMSLAGARAKAVQWRDMVKAGVDPQKREAEQEAAERAAEERKTQGSLRAVAEKYIGRHVARLRRGRAVELIVNQLIERWGARPIDEIRRRDIISLIEEINERGKPAMARYTFSTCRALFNYARERDLIETSPCDGVKSTKLIGPTPIRSRILTDAELKALWEATERLGYPYQHVIRLLMLTGQRRTEVAEMRWSEIDLAAHLWTIPAARMKGKVAHTVALSDAALEILQSLPRFVGSDLCFTLSGGPLNDFAATKGKLDKLIGVSDWVLHDLRRTVRSGLSALAPSDMPRPAGAPASLRPAFIRGRKKNRLGKMGRPAPIDHRSGTKCCCATVA